MTNIVGQLRSISSPSPSATSASKTCARSAVQCLYASLLKSGTGVRTVRIVHAVLHRSLEKAVRYGLILRNPTEGAALPQYKHAEMQVLDETQVSQLLVAAKCSRHEALYHLAVTTGMRMGELFGLRWSDLHWVSGRIYVRRQVQYVPGQGWSFVEPKTRSGRRTIKLGEGVLQALREHLVRQQGERVAAGERWVDYDLIFPSKSGTPLDPSNLRLDFTRVSYSRPAYRRSASTTCATRRLH